MWRTRSGVEQSRSKIREEFRYPDWNAVRNALALITALICFCFGVSVGVTCLFYIT